MLRTRCRVCQILPGCCSCSCNHGRFGQTVLDRALHSLRPLNVFSGLQTSHPTVKVSRGVIVIPRKYEKIMEKKMSTPIEARRHFTGMNGPNESTLINIFRLKPGVLVSDTRHCMVQL